MIKKIREDGLLAFNDDVVGGSVILFQVIGKEEFLEENWEPF